MRPKPPLTFLLRLLTQGGKLGFRLLMILIPVVAGALWNMFKNGIAQGVDFGPSETDKYAGAPGPEDTDHPDWDATFGYRNPSFHPGVDR